MIFALDKIGDNIYLSAVYLNLGEISAYIFSGFAAFFISLKFKLILLLLIFFRCCNPICKKKNRLSDEFPCFGDKLPFIPDFSWKYSNDNNGRRNNLHQKKKKNNNKFIKDISFFYCDLQLLNLCIHSRNLPRDNSINRNGSNQFYRQIWLCCRAGINLIL